MNALSTLEYIKEIYVQKFSEDFLSVFLYASGLGTLAYAALKFFQAKTSPLCSIPTVGYSGVFTSYITALQFVSNGPSLLREGYEKFNGKPFKVATLSRWFVVVSGPKYIQDLSRAPDEVVDVNGPNKDNNQVKHTFGSELLDDPYHVITIRGPVTRNIEKRYDTIIDEVVHSLQEYVPPNKDWLTVPAFDTFLHIFCRATNRFLVGSKLCRDPQYQDLSERLSHEVVDAARIIGRCPGFLRPVAAFFSTIRSTMKECRELLGPIIAERLNQYQQNERVLEKTEETEDSISWFIETSTKDSQRTIEDITLRVMVINVAALHVSTMVLTQVMYDFATHPEYAKELREEVEKVLSEYGWTRKALHKMCKLDSFLKESHRMNSIAHYLVVRETIQDFTLFDGTLIPAGNHIGVAAGAINMSEKYYQDADTFKGFRFAEMREGDDELDTIRHQMVSLDPSSVIFGHGKHACPGRFLAVTLLKTIFAYIILQYDVQMENGSTERPPNAQSGITCVPDTHAKMRFRKRGNVC